MQDPVRPGHRNSSRGPGLPPVGTTLTLRPRPQGGRAPPGPQRIGARLPGPARCRTGGPAVNLPTTRYSSPAASKRTGRPPCALPRDEGLDRLLADPRLGSTAKTIATALVKNWAWSKDHCWPSDRTIGLRVGKSPSQVQRCLRQLEGAGWIVRERTHEVRTGRRLWLAWRLPTGSDARPRSAGMREGDAATMRDERI